MVGKLLRLIAKIMPRNSSSPRADFPCVTIRFPSVLMIIMFLIITGVAVGRGLLGAVPAGISLPSLLQSCIYAGFQHLGDLLNVGTETTTKLGSLGISARSLFCRWCISFFLVFVSSLVRLFPHLRALLRKLVPGAKPALDWSQCVLPSCTKCCYSRIFVFLCWRNSWFDLAALMQASFLSLLFFQALCLTSSGGATAGVFGNAEGGIRAVLPVRLPMACSLPSFLHFVCRSLRAWALHLQRSLTPTSRSWRLFLGNVALNAQGLILTIICIVCFLLPILYNLVAPKHEVSETAEKTTK